MNFKTQVKAKLNQSNDDKINIALDDFVEDTILDLESDISIYKATTIPKLKSEMAKCNRRIKNHKKNLKEVILTVFKSKDEIYTSKEWIANIVRAKRELAIAERQLSSFSEEIETANEKIEELQELINLLK